MQSSEHEHVKLFLEQSFISSSVHVFLFLKIADRRTFLHFISVIISLQSITPFCAGKKKKKTPALVWPTNTCQALLMRIITDGNLWHFQPFFHDIEGGELISALLACQKPGKVKMTFLLRQEVGEACATACCYNWKRTLDDHRNLIKLEIFHTRCLWIKLSPSSYLSSIKLKTVKLYSSIVKHILKTQLV